MINFQPALYVLMQKAEILDTCCLVKNFLAEQRKRCTWSGRPVRLENQINNCEVRNVDDDNDDDDDYDDDNNNNNNNNNSTSLPLK